MTLSIYFIGYVLCYLLLVVGFALSDDDPKDSHILASFIALAASIIWPLMLPMIFTIELMKLVRARIKR